MLLTKHDEIMQVKMQRPHVVIMGAGASIAATIPFNGDKNGRKLPSMMNFVDTLGIQQILHGSGIIYNGRNFEDIYDEIYDRPDLLSHRIQLEDAVSNYFSSLVLPDKATVYDLLVLSLRNKDIVATFNWDPFLIQAIRRNSHLGLGLPTPIFLHGNVLAGYCPCGKFIGLVGTHCRKCGSELIASKLLFPIKNKDYVGDPFIATQWEILKQELSSAFMVSIYGYGAPSSDIGAVNLMLDAWGSPAYRNLEQFEIINVLPEDELYRTWLPFINSHHYEVHKSLEESWIGMHPRRTGEAYWNQYMDAQFIEDNPAPKNASLEDLQDWFLRFRASEL